MYNPLVGSLPDSGFTVVPGKRDLDFLVIGASRAGTTSLFEYMRTHPELYLPPAKEEPFFSDDDRFRRGWDEYREHAFLGAPDRALWGKVTPQYLGGRVRWDDSTRRAAERDPEGVIPSRIAQLFPRLKLIALLRNPVERAVSHYWLAVLRGLESRSLDRALLDQLEPRALREARVVPTATNCYITAGEYGRLLRGYLEYFPREQLFVASSQSLSNDPIQVLLELWRFVGVDDRHRPSNLGIRYFTRAKRRHFAQLDTALLPRFVRKNAILGGVWGSLPASIRNRMRAGYGRAAYRVNRWNRVPDERRLERPDPEVLERLRAHYQVDRSLLNDILGPVAGLGFEPGVGRTGGEVARLRTNRA
jgi:hypothetical protein